MYPICYRRVSGVYIQPEPAMYSRCFVGFQAPSPPVKALAMKVPILKPINPEMDDPI